MIALLLSSCGVLDAGGKNTLNGSSWTLVSFRDQTLIPGTTMTARFDSGEISGSASCNHYFGSYQAKNGKIQISGLGWTEMACMDPEGIMQQEQQLMANLSLASTYSIQGQTLIIETGDGSKFVFSQLDFIN
jgi:heat shock protein HslJ